VGRSAVLPYVPAELLRYLSRLLAAERRRRATPARSRKLTCHDQAIQRPVFEPIGNPVSVGGVGAGHAVKALNNLAAVDALRRPPTRPSWPAGAAHERTPRRPHRRPNDGAAAGPGFARLRNDLAS
jgi:hypothetical protein